MGVIISHSFNLSTVNVIILIFLDRMHLLFIQVHFLFWQPGMVVGQYTTISRSSRIRASPKDAFLWYISDTPFFRIVDRLSIPSRVIPKTQKMLLDASLLNTHKVLIKGKVEQSRERSSALPYTLVLQLLKRKPSSRPRLRSPTLLYLPLFKGCCKRVLSHIDKASN